MDERPTYEEIFLKAVWNAFDNRHPCFSGDCDHHLGRDCELAIKDSAREMVEEYFKPAPLEGKATRIPHPGGKKDRMICAGCSVDLFPPAYNCPTPNCKLKLVEGKDPTRSAPAQEPNLDGSAKRVTGSEAEPSEGK